MIRDIDAVITDLEVNGWSVIKKVAIGIPSADVVLEARKKNRNILVYPVGIFPDRNYIMIDRKLISDLKFYARRHKIEVYVAVSFGASWIYKSIENLQDATVYRSEIGDLI